MVRGDDGYVVRLARPGDEPAIEALFREVFGDRSSEIWRWRYGQAPGGPPFCVVFETDGQVVGQRISALHVATLDGRPLVVGIGGDAMVHPDHRGRSGLRRMRAVVTEHAPFELRLSFPTDQVVHAAHEKAPEVVGRLPQWVRFLQPGAVTASRPGVPRPIAAAVPRISAAVGGTAGVIGRVGRRVEEVRSFDERFDRLADRAAGWARAVRRRDAAYLRHRWIDRPDGPRPVFAATDRRGDLRGFVVLADDRRAGARLGVPVGRVVDLLADDAATTVALLAEASSRLRRAGAAIALLDLQDSRPWVGRALRLAGFLQRGAGVNVSALPNACFAGEQPVLPGEWYLTYGDTDLC